MVRRFPVSRRHPHFSQDALAAALAGRGVGYCHFPDLGGWRQPVPGSPNGGWRTAGFQGYADHVATPAFATALAHLLALAAGTRVAILCAEANPYHCHRQLMADALLIRQVQVVHILDHGAKPHRLTPFARVKVDRLIYPPPGGPRG